MPIRDKLKRLEGHTGLVSQQASSPPAQKLEQDSPNQNKWAHLNATFKWLDDHYIIVREVSYPLETLHGSTDFSSLFKAVSTWNDKGQKHPLSSIDLQADQLIFFDTETTGLYTGAGHHIFLLGYAQVTMTHVNVKQYLLPGPEAEAALYYHFLNDVSDMRYLVTYNGKAFDWPQVKTRHTFVRNQVPKLPAFGHFDLLHASRRLWKNELPSCKLSIVEEQKLGVIRQNDTPSYLVPMLYFDFVKEQSPDLVEGVLKHHEWDLLSLITLYSNLSFKLLDCSDVQVTAEEHFEMGRWFAAVGEGTMALHHLEKAMNPKTNVDEIELKSLYEIAMLKKKQKKHNEALSYFKQLVDREYRMIETAIECAKIYEHTFKQLDQAIYYTKTALTEADFTQSTKSQQLYTPLQNRLDRLEAKRTRNS